MRNRIRHGHNAHEPKHAVVIALHHRAAIRLIPAIVVLHVVLPVAVGFPHVDLGAGHGGAGGSFDGAQDEQGGAGGVSGDGGARGEVGSVVGVKGAEDGAFG